MLNAISEGLASGNLNINGEDIDVTDAAELEDLRDKIEDLRNADLSGYSHDDLTKGAGAILAVIGGILLVCCIIGIILNILYLIRFSWAATASLWQIAVRKQVSVKSRAAFNRSIYIM